MDVQKRSQCGEIDPPLMSHESPCVVDIPSRGTLNPLLTSLGHNSRMISRAADGSSFRWQIAKSAHGGFDGNPVARRVGDQAYSE